jgi:hypothetical protein
MKLRKIDEFMRVVSSLGSVSDSKIAYAAVKNREMGSKTLRQFQVTSTPEMDAYYKALRSNGGQLTPELEKDHAAGMKAFKDAQEAYEKALDEQDVVFFVHSVKAENVPFNLNPSQIEAILFMVDNEQALMNSLGISKTQK